MSSTGIQSSRWRRCWARLLALVLLPGLMAAPQVRPVGLRRLERLAVLRVALVLVVARRQEVRPVAPLVAQELRGLE